MNSPNYTDKIIYFTYDKPRRYHNDILVDVKIMPVSLPIKNNNIPLNHDALSRVTEVSLAFILISGDNEAIESMCKG